MAQISSFIRRNPNDLFVCDASESELIRVEIHSETPPDEEFDINGVFFEKQTCRSEVISKDNGCAARNFKTYDESSNGVISSEKVLAEILRDGKCANKQNGLSSLNHQVGEQDFSQDNNLESDWQLNVSASNNSDKMPPIQSINLENSAGDISLAKSEFHFLSDAKYESTSDCEEFFSVSENGVSTLDSLLSPSAQIQSNSSFTNGKLIADSLYGSNIVDFDCLNDLLEANSTDKTQITSKQASSGTNDDKYCLNVLTSSLKNNTIGEDEYINDFLSACINQDVGDSTESDCTEYSKKSSSVDSGCGSYCGSSEFYASDYSNCSSVSQTSENQVNQGEWKKTEIQELNLPSDSLSNYCLNSENCKDLETANETRGNAIDLFCLLTEEKPIPDSGLNNLLQHCAFDVTTTERSTPLCALVQNHYGNKAEFDQPLDSGIGSLSSVLTENDYIKNTSYSDQNHFLRQCVHNQKHTTKASLTSLAQNVLASKLECKEDLHPGIDSLSSFLSSENDCNKSTSDSDVNSLLQQCTLSEINTVKNESLALLAQSHFTNKLECEEQSDSINSSLSSFLNNENNSNNSPIDVIKNTCPGKHKSKPCAENELAVESSLLDIFKSVGENCQSNICVDETEESQGKVESSKTAAVQSSLLDIFKSVGENCHSSVCVDKTVESAGKVESSKTSAELISDVDLNSCVKYKPSVPCHLSKLPLIPYVRLTGLKDKVLNLQNPDFVCHSISEIDASNFCVEQLKINAVKESLFAKALSCKAKSNKMSQEKVLKIKRGLLEKYYPQPLWHDSCKEHVVINEKTIFQSECIMSGDRYLVSASGVKELQQCD